MTRFVEIQKEKLITNIHAVAEAERKSDGSVALFYIGGATSTLLPGKEADELWEMLQRASQTPRTIVESQGLSPALEL